MQLKSQIAAFFSFYVNEMDSSMVVFGFDPRFGLGKGDVAYLAPNTGNEKPVFSRLNSSPRRERKKYIFSEAVQGLPQHEANLVSPPPPPAGPSLHSSTNLSTSGKRPSQAGHTALVTSPIKRVSESLVQVRPPLEEDNTCPHVLYVHTGSK